MSSPRRQLMAPWLLVGVLVALGGATDAPARERRPAPVTEEARSLALDLLAQAATAEARGNKAEALRLSQESARAAPSPAAHYNAGRLLAAQGRRAEAIAAFDQALLLNPKYESARLARERLQTKHGIGNIDLIALEREAETAASLEESAAAAAALAPQTQSGNRTLAQAGPSPEEVRRGIPAPPATPRATPAVPNPPKFADATLPPAQNSAPGRTSILSPIGRSMIQVREGFARILDPRGETGPEPDTKGKSVVPTPPKPATGRPAPATFSPAQPPAARPDNAQQPAADQGGSAKRDPAAGGRPGEWASRFSLFPRRPAPAPLPESRTFDGRSAAEVNAAAFSPEAAKRPPSTAYGQPTGTAALGTFAFHRDRGDSYRTMNRWAEARQEYDFALRQAPGDAETRALLGEMQARLGDSRRALRNLDQAAKDAPTLAAVAYRRGNALRALDRKPLAIGAYLDAVRLDPQNTDALNNLGVTYMETGSYQKAADAYGRLLKIQPDNPNAILNLGILHEDHLNDPASAKKFYERYLQLPDVPRKQEVRRWLSLLEPKPRR